MNKFKKKLIEIAKTIMKKLKDNKSDNNKKKNLNH